MKNSYLQIEEEKKLIAELIFKVLDRKTSVREALEKFPCNIKDNSIQVAWHALMHFEADDDIRKQDIEYAQEQDNFLKETALLLQKNESLPENILEEYNKYHDPVIKSESKGILNKIKSIFRFII